jgi:hypothetical protein
MATILAFESSAALSAYPPAGILLLTEPTEEQQNGMSISRRPSVGSRSMSCPNLIPNARAQHRDELRLRSIVATAIS